VKKHILIFGATSGIGRFAMEEALSRGHVVRAFGRSADTLERASNLEPFAGDALEPEDVARALEGVDVVISSLGIKESIAMLWQEVTLFSRSNEILINAMQDRGMKRLIVVTGFGAGRSRAAMSALEKLGHRAILGKPYADKDRQEEMIVASDLDWTIVRPVILTNSAKSGGFKVLRDPSKWRNGLISRRDVAQYLIDASESDLDMRADVVLAR
jgi:uncharacterized protein YbjT (DUF2867 family)